jgi:dihydrofolate reductase
MLGSPKLSKNNDHKNLYYWWQVDLPLSQSLADKLYLKVVEGSYQADTYFPNYTALKKVVHQKRQSEDYKYTFIELTK